ncbi:MAG: metal-sensitive transcriptional regulator [Patescibacteria group bacterium]|jgi:DNA-binding FrmR family transcriptional regulator
MKEMPGKISREEQSRKVLDRISRLEGQIRGIRRMVGEKKECIDIITQISAIREAAAMLGIELLKDDFICHKIDANNSERYLKTLFKIN